MGMFKDPLGDYDDNPSPLIGVALIVGYIGFVAAFFHYTHKSALADSENLNYCLPGAYYSQCSNKPYSDKPNNLELKVR